MGTDVDVAIVGAGQAGLATSWHLKQLGVEHVIVEAGRVAQTWRSRRWDSFCLVTPNWTAAKLPGSTVTADADAYMPLGELVEFFDAWARSFDAPVIDGCAVTALDRDDGAFTLTLPDRSLRARAVVIASGGYQRAHLPDGASCLPPSVTQLLAEEYRNPDAVPPGAVLVVGSGQTGIQLAEELHEAGRKVILACGRCPWAPRRFGGHDVVWWVINSGFWNRTPADLPSPAARLLGNVQASGHKGGHDLHFRVLHEIGVELVGRYAGAEDGKVHFADDLNATLDTSDNLARVFKKSIDALCAREGWPIPWEVPAPLRVDARTELDLAAEGVGTVIWTAGYRPAYDWVHVPVFDAMGFPIQVDGRSEVPGLYFMGVHFQRKAQSAVLYGVGEDAEIVAADIAGRRR